MACAYLDELCAALHVLADAFAEGVGAFDANSLKVTRQSAFAEPRAS
jgi:hypothetical protein